ncbi:MAG TPA: 50S ribosomal protein L18 [Deltaproteobacteria bacterium]|nr:50S ribosomal protein L18 [Deltaproteobacteria bacterium]
MSKKIEGRLRRKQRIRKKITGTVERPRLTIYRSSKHIYAQVIDDTTGRTLCAASTNEKGQSGGRRNKSNATELGKRIAEKAKSAQVASVVFDRNGYIYHGCVKAFADAVREAGLQF